VDDEQKAQLDRDFSELYKAHLRDVYSYAYYRVGNHHDAEDLTEQTFLQAYRHFERAQRESDGRPLRPWLIRIAHNLAANYYRDRARGSVRTWVLGIVHNRAIDARRRTVVHERRRASDEGIEERFEARERTEVEAARRDEAETIRGMLDALPAEQSRVIELAYFGGFTHSEIAEMLGAPIGTVKGRMRLGLEKLRGQLAPQGAM